VPTSDVVSILLVEDSAEDAELTVRALRRAHLTNPIRVVEDGVEALEILFGPGADDTQDAPRAPRLILLDVKLPKLSGVEVLRLIKADPRTKSIPVVMLTSSREDRDVRECYALGANSYVVKPVESEAFIKAVSQTALYWTLINQPPS
jgi:CheY-like chemotaxis protein